MGYYPQESLSKPYKYHGYTVRGTPNCPLNGRFSGVIFSLKRTPSSEFDEGSGESSCGSSYLLVKLARDLTRVLGPKNVAVWKGEFPGYFREI